MNQEQLDRAKRSEDQTAEKKIYWEFKALVDDCDNPPAKLDLISAIRCYYDRAVGQSCWATIEKDIWSLPIEDLRETLLKLATEAINYDMRQYILRGKRGERASKMLAALRG